MKTALILMQQTAVMFILILFGVFLYKKGVFTKRGGKQLSNFVISAVCPVLIFTSFQKPMEERLVKGLLMAFLMATLSHIASIAASTAIFREKNRGENYAVERFASIYSNCAFLGIPLANSVYGSDGVFFITAYIAMFNIFSWTHGVMVMKGKMNVKSFLHAVKAPAVIAAVLGAVFFFAGILLPDIIIEPLNYVASLNTPLAMIVSGIMIAQSDLKKALKNGGLYLTSIVKLLAAPLVSMLIFLPLGADRIVTYTMIIAASAPTAASTIMFANKYGKNGVYASELFAMTTLLSIVTMPLMLVLAENVYTLI